MPTASLGLRVDVAGRSISYSGDTAWTDTLVDLDTGEAAFDLAHDGRVIDL